MTGDSWIVIRRDTLKVKSYKDLNVWQKGLEIVEKIYNLTKTFPRYEVYGIASQMQRSAISIPSNIAEGFMRQHNKEYVQFLYVALGSCAELETQLIISQKMNYVKQESFNYLQEIIEHESRMLVNLIKALK